MHDEMVRAHVRVTGRVQGVWFRRSTAEEARSLGLAGWVRNAGDDVYVFTAVGTGQHAVGGVTYFETPYLTKQTIWDSAGIDTLDASWLPAAAGGYRLDLRGGGWLIGNSQSLVTSYDHGSTLAMASAIENVVNSGSDDTIYANSAANQGVILRGEATGGPSGSSLAGSSSHPATIIKTTATARQRALITDPPENRLLR